MSIKLQKKEIDVTGRKSEEYVTRVYIFDKYDIIVKMTTDGRFVGIEEVRVNKDFMKNKSVSSRISTRVDELPPE